MMINEPLKLRGNVYEIVVVIVKQSYRQQFAFQLPTIE